MLSLFWQPSIWNSVGYPMHLPHNKSKFTIIYSDCKHILIMEEKNSNGKL